MVGMYLLQNNSPIKLFKGEVLVITTAQRLHWSKSQSLNCVLHVLLAVVSFVFWPVVHDILGRILTERLDTNTETRTGITGAAVICFELHMLNRTQFVHVNSCFSLHIKLQFGVPQGSVFGSICFILYVLSLSYIIYYNDVIHFFYYVLLYFSLTCC